MANPNAIKKHPRVSQVHIDETRARIAAHNLITRLQRFALGTMVMVAQRGKTGETELKAMIEDEDGNRTPAMTKEQVAAASKLLSYVLPTLQSVEVKSEETRTYVLRAPSPSKSVDDWLKDYGPKTIEGKLQ